MFEHPERPSQKIINNDDLLDKWVEEKSKEMEDRAKKNSKGYKNSMSAHDHEEVIIFDEEEWEDVLDEEAEYDEDEDE